MATVTVNDASLTAIADAIREKLDVDTTYLPSQMAEAIESISGTDLTSADEGKVVVESSGEYVLQTQTSLSVSQNGTYDTTTNDEVVVNVSGGGCQLYTNFTYAESQIISDVTGFTKLYDTTVPFGSYGTKVSTLLDVTDESAISALMANGWSANGSACYDSENKTGAYAGYDFGMAMRISKAKFWIGRYSGQNKTLYATVQYLDANDDWHDVEDLEVTITLPYPINVFEVGIDAGTDIYGIRWIHKKEPEKSGGNNLCFFGMTVYESTGRVFDTYKPSSSGLIEPPSGYDGFGPLYIQ